MTHWDIGGLVIFTMVLLPNNGKFSNFTDKPWNNLVVGSFYEIATAKVVYPETRAALARGLREETLALAAYKEAVMNFIFDPSRRKYAGVPLTFKTG